MTTSPNKMSEEIRKQLVKSLSIAQVESVDDNGEAVIEYEADRLLKLITADRKRVELEARVDELEKFVNTTNRSLSVKKLRDRLSALKAQQEEVLKEKWNEDTCSL